MNSGLQLTLPGADTLSRVEAAIVRGARSAIIICLAISPLGVLAVGYWLSQGSRYGYGAMPFAPLGIVGVLTLYVLGHISVAKYRSLKAPREHPVYRALADGSARSVSLDIGPSPSLSLIGHEGLLLTVGHFTAQEIGYLKDSLRAVYPDLMITRVVVVMR
jgi:hypothetical protein